MIYEMMEVQLSILLQKSMIAEKQFILFFLLMFGMENQALSSVLMPFFFITFYIYLILLL